MNKFFMGLFTVLTVLSGIATFASRPASQGDSVNRLVHSVALANVTQVALATARREKRERAERAASRNVRWGSTHSTYSSNNRYGGGGGSYSRSSYRGGK